jgi:hypothetical protein
VSPNYKEGLEELRSQEVVPVEGHMLAALLEVVASAERVIRECKDDNGDGTTLCAALLVLSGSLVQLDQNLKIVESRRELEKFNGPVGSA